MQFCIDLTALHTIQDYYHSHKNLSTIFVQTLLHHTLKLYDIEKRDRVNNTDSDRSYASDS